MRTFIAIPLPPNIIPVLESLQKQLRSFGAEVRWTSVRSMHLTLKFLGEIDPAILPDVARVTREAGAVSAFQLRIEGLGAFPDLRNPRVFWCGFGGDTQALELLQARVEAACATLGLPAEERPFHPHLTLGRVQGKRNLHRVADYIKIASSPGMEFVVGHFHIYRSVLTPGGPIYTVLESIALRPAQDAPEAEAAPDQQ